MTVRFSSRRNLWPGSGRWRRSTVPAQFLLRRARLAMGGKVIYTPPPPPPPPPHVYYFVMENHEWNIQGH
jgi:hypothetical protein